MLLRCTPEKGRLGLKGGNDTGVGWIKYGYIKGAFYILLYPALARRMHMLSVFLVVPFWGQILGSVQLSAVIGNDNTRHLFRSAKT